MRLSRHLACIALAAALAAPAVHAEPFDRLLPDSTVFYYSVESITRTTERFKKSALFALWNDPAIQTFLDKPLKKWADEMTKLKAEDGITPEEIFKVLGGQVVVAIPEVEFDERGRMEPHIVALADIGENEEDVKRLIARLEEVKLKDENVRRMEEEFRGVTIVHYARADEEEEGKGAKRRDEPNCWFLDGKTLAISDNVEDLKKLLARRGDTESPSLAVHEGYRRVRNRLGEDPEAVAFLNVQAINKAMAESKDDDLVFFRALTGMDSVDGAGAQLKLGRGGMALSLFLSVPGERQGLLKLFDAKNTPLVPPKWVPKDASDVTTMAIDFPALLAEARKVEAKIGEAGTIDMAFEVAKGMGIDVEKDVIGSLGKEITFFSKLPPEGAQQRTMVPAMTFAIEVKDKAKLDAALTTMLTLAQQQAGLPVEEEDYLGVKIRTINMFIVQLGIVMLPDQFLLSTDPEALKDVIRSYGKDVKGVVDAEDFVRGAAILPEGRILVGFSRFAKAVRQGILGVLVGGGGLDPKLFPKAEVIEKYLDVASSAMVNEEAGIFYTFVLAFKKGEDGEGGEAGDETPRQPGD